MSDQLFKFMLGAGHVRGVSVRLEATWQEMRRRRTHAPDVETLLGEMSAAAALLAGSLKFDGTLILQIQGDGPVRLAVAECQPDFGLRATAKADADAHGGLPALTNVHGGGRCVITLDPRARGDQDAGRASATPGAQPYQGIVALDDPEGLPLGDLAAVLRQYLAQSEQIPSWLLLAADAHCATGLLVQRMPEAGGDPAVADEDFARAVHLASTLSREELLATAPEEVLRRLFWEEQARVFQPLYPRFHCTCSRERVARMLRMLGRDEVESILAERGEVEVACEFCGAGYTLDLVDAAQLFVSGIDQPPGSAARQ